MKETKRERKNENERERQHYHCKYVSVESLKTYVNRFAIKKDSFFSSQHHCHQQQQLLECRISAPSFNFPQIYLHTYTLRVCLDVRVLWIFGIVQGYWCACVYPNKITWNKCARKKSEQENMSNIQGAPKVHSPEYPNRLMRIVAFVIVDLLFFFCFLLYIQIP